MADVHDDAPRTDTLRADFDAMADAVSAYRRRLQRYQWTVALLSLLFAGYVVATAYLYVADQTERSSAEQIWRARAEQDMQGLRDQTEVKLEELRQKLGPQILTTRQMELKFKRDYSKKVDDLAVRVHDLEVQLKAAQAENAQLRQGQPKVKSGGGEKQLSPKSN